MDLNLTILLRWHRALFIVLLFISISVFPWTIAGCGRQKGSPAVSQSEAIQKARFEDVSQIFKPLDVFLVLDQSGSMLTTDPQNLRLSASRFFLSYLRTYASKSQDHRAGIIGFGSYAPREHTYPLASVLTKGEEIKGAIKQANLNNTNFLEAFRQAYEGFQSGDNLNEQHQRSLVVFTDGRPDRGDGTPPEKLFSELEAFVQQYFIPQNILLFIVAIDQKGEYWSKDKPFWDRMAQATYQITSMQGLDRVFHEILVKLIGGDSERLTPQSPGQPIKVVVEPYLERVSFLALKEGSQAGILVTMPNGQRVPSRTEGSVTYSTGEKGSQFEIYSIADPEPGDWTLELTGKGTVEVFKDALRLQATLLNPSSPYPQGRPMGIEVKLIHRDGRQVKPIHGYPLRLSAGIERPNKKQEFVGLIEREQGLFVSEHVISTPDKGLYHVTLSLKGGEVPVFQQTFPVDVRPLPYIAVDEPKDGVTYPIKRHLRLSGLLMREQRPISAQEAFDEDPDGVAIIRLTDLTENRTLFADFLKEQKREAASLFSCTLPHIKNEGTYQIDIRLAGRLIDGTDYRSVIERIRFAKAKIFWDHWADIWYLMLIVAVIVGMLTFMIWLRAPTLIGKIEALNLSSNQTQSIMLNGRRFRLSRVRLGASLPKGYFIAKKDKTYTGEVITKPIYCEYKGIKALIPRTQWILRAITVGLIFVVIIMAFRYEARLGISVTSALFILSLLWGIFWRKIERASSIEMNPDIPTSLGDWIFTYRY